MAKIPFFNSKDVEWSDMKINIAGSEPLKVRGIRYGVNQEKELLHAAGSKPIGIQAGNISYTGEIRVLKSVLDDMNAAAIIAGGDNALGISFDVVITYKARGVRPLKIDTLIGVELTELTKGWEQGARFMEITLPFIFLDLKSV